MLRIIAQCDAWQLFNEVLGPIFKFWPEKKAHYQCYYTQCFFFFFFLQVFAERTDIEKNPDGLSFRRQEIEDQDDSINPEQQQERVEDIEHGNRKGKDMFHARLSQTHQLILLGLLKHPDMLNLFTQAKDVKDIEDVDSLPHVPNIDPKEIFCEAFRALQEDNPDFAVANNSMSHCKIRYN